jgi:anti-sigma factor RsiW
VTHLTDMQLQRLADGTLRGPEGMAAHEHCDSCKGCGSEMQIYAALCGQLSALADPPPPPDFTASVLARVQAQEYALAARRDTLLAAVPAVMLAMVAIVGAGMSIPVGTLLDGLNIARTVFGVLTPVFEAVRLPLGIGAFFFLAVVLTALSRTLRPVHARMAGS